MATRTETCKWCSTRLLVRIDVQTISCPRCRGVTHRQPSNNAYVSSYGNRNGNGNGYGNYGNNGGQSFDNGYRLGMSTTNYGNNGGQYYDQNYRQGTPNRVVPSEQSFGRPQGSLVPVRGQKRAVLCGVSYKEHAKRLDGSINDVMSMKYLLIKSLGFPDACIIVLTEDEKDPSRIPTKMNIRRAMNWLVQGCQPGDSLVFHYSGHGSKVKDRTGDEMDGHDEALCPVDFETEGRILDDELNSTLISPLTRGVTLHTIIDTCFSGTFLDLPFMCRVNREGSYMWEDHRMQYSSCKGTRGGLAICISACDDHQTSGDTTAFTGTSQGALTYSFTQTVANEPRLTYGQLLLTMRNKIHGAQKTFSQNGAEAPAVQEPQLSATEQFDIHLKQFTM